jgi:hypothetical protein
VETLPPQARPLLKAPVGAVPVVVPALAGLLVALAAVGVIWLAGGYSDPGRGSGETGPAPAPAGGQSAVPSEARRLPPAFHASAVVVMPVEAPSGYLLDGDRGTCVPLADPRGASLEFQFDAPRRFSHVTLTAGCLDKEDSREFLEMTIATEDGARRFVRIPHAGSTLWVDLAGAWSSRVAFTIEPGQKPGLGMAEVTFFAFRKE